MDWDLERSLFEPANHWPASTTKPIKTSYCLAVFKTWLPWKITSCLFGKYTMSFKLGSFFSEPAIWVYHRLVSMVLFLAHLFATPRRLNLGSQHWHQRCRAANVAMVIRTVDDRFVAMLPQWPLHWERCWRTSIFWAKKNMEDGEKIWNSPFLKPKKPWRHSVWVYICVLFFARKYGTLQRS